MNIPFLSARSHPRARVAAVAIAALSVPAYLSLTLSGAAPGDPPGTGTSTARGTAVANVVDPPGSPGELVFSSYLGGQEWDEATGVATDRDGNSYVTGFTLSEDFPRVGSGARGHGAIHDAFVTKVAADGSRIEWSTQIGGVDMDPANAVTVDRDGNVYVVGRTGSPDFPTTSALQRRLRGRACTGKPCHDAFVVKLSSTGQIHWSTLFGGTLNEEALSVAVDEDSAVYVAGLTDSPDLPVRHAFQAKFQSPPCEGDVPCPYDAFVTKLAPTGDRVVYSTYLGGNAADLARGIDVDSDGNAYVSAAPDHRTSRRSGPSRAPCAARPADHRRADPAGRRSSPSSTRTAPRRRTAPTSAGRSTTTPTAWPWTANNEPTSPEPPSPRTSPPATPSKRP
jgi:hypothetical protein